MKWFRLHSDAVDDPKLKLLAFEDRWHFVALLCLKAEGTLDQDVSPELLTRMVAAKLGLQFRDLDELKRRLIEVHLIDDQWQPVNWEKRQYKSDNSTERVRKHREKQRHNDTERDRNVSETVSPHARATETDSETETDISTSNEVEVSASDADIAKPNGKHFPIQTALENYNTVAGELGLPQAERLTESRRRKIRARLAEHGPAKWNDALMKIYQSSFLRGHNDRGWRANLDFLVRPDNFAKLLEGGYDDVGAEND